AGTLVSQQASHKSSTELKEVKPCDVSSSAIRSSPTGSVRTRSWSGPSTRSCTRPARPGSGTRRSGSTTGRRSCTSPPRRPKTGATRCRASRRSAGSSRTSPTAARSRRRSPRCTRSARTTCSGANPGPRRLRPMMTLVAELGNIQERLDALARQHRVPGAVLAVSTGEEELEFATGVINTSTGVAATADTVFQIGSNTKLLTTTLVMQLVEAGQVELDALVRRYLPTFELAGPGAGEITVRHLLTHTSGIEGDHFEDFGRGDDA